MNCIKLLVYFPPSKRFGELLCTESIMNCRGLGIVFLGNKKNM